MPAPRSTARRPPGPKRDINHAIGDGKRLTASKARIKNPPAPPAPPWDPLGHLLYEDAEALVLDKPAGLPVDAPRDGAGSVEMALGALRFGFARAPSIVHRLDRDTSGCLLLARTDRAHRRFAAAFEAGEVGKSYLAVLDGVPGAAAGEIDLPLAKRSTREAGWRIVADAKGKPARTAWRLLGEAGGRALLLLAPATGRTHQLRVHMASGLALPIAGDPVYGRDGGARGGGLMLHAWRLTMPREGKAAIVAEAPPPAAFAPWAEYLADAG